MSTRQEHRIIILFTLTVALLFAAQAAEVQAAQRKVVPKKKEVAVSFDAEQRVALVIGNGDYTSAPLKNPANDARLMAKTLKEVGFEVIKLENASQTDMKRAIDDFGEKIRKGGVGLFYYAGHGMQVKGQNYLIPIGATIKVERDVEYESLDVGRVFGKMEAAQNRLNIVMLDACRDNPFARSFRSASRGLATVDASFGTFIAYATSPGSTAADGDGANGIFTEEFVKTVKQKGLEINDVFNNVRAGVMERTEKKQVPWQASSLVGKFYFAKGSVIVEEPVIQEEPATPQAEEITTGRLTIKTTAAGAQVYIDGNKAGTAPVTKALSPGNYNIELRKEGYKAATETVRVEKGKEKTVSLLMEKNTGSIRVSSNPAGGKVYIDGAYTDTAPNTITDLKAGTYKIKVTKDGYSEWSGSVRVGEGEEAEISASLKEAQKPQRVSAASTAGTITDPTTGMEFVYVKGGCYQMGDTFGDGEADEKPVHEVCVDDFYIGKYEVTVGEFRKFVNEVGYSTEAEKGDGCYGWTGGELKKSSSYNWRNLGFSQDDRHPVACVSWNDARAYAEWQSRKSGKAYRLPTEAEWEYAARSGGKSEKYAGGNAIDSVAWYNGNSGSRTHPAGEKQPNGLGIYDMSGNVWEWVQDWYNADYYKSSPRDNPKGPGSEQYKVLRGGSCDSGPVVARAALRYGLEPATRIDSLGFRLAAPAR